MSIRGIIGGMKDQLMKHDFFTALPFWDKLDREEQSTVEQETKGLAQAHAAQVVMRTKMGEHLANLQKVLEGKGLFVRYLTSLKFTYRTAYRYIEAYKAVKERLPDFALEAAAARGIDLVGYQGNKPFGPYTEAVKRLPPPKQPAHVAKWLDSLEEERRKHRSSPRHRKVDGQRAMRSLFRQASAVYKKLDGTKQRQKWAVQLIGILMGEFGLPAQTIQPEAPPDGFRAVLGRPKEKMEREAVPA